MKKFEITEDWIKLLADNNSWSESKLKEWYPSVFKSEFEIGKWYTPKKQNEGIALFCVTSPSNIYNIGKGFDFKGDWTDMFNICGNSNPNSFRLATPQEVQTALINEAKKRGFVEGVKYNCNGILRRKDNVVCGIVKCEYWGGKNEGYGLHCTNNGWIFKDGVWATICKEQLPTELQSLVDKIGKEEIIKLLSK
jgi:hypothetical protein